jgi:apolipoprotein N-acyltransferase
MKVRERIPPASLIAALYFALLLAELYLAILGPLALGTLQLGDASLIGLFMLHWVWALTLLFPRSTVNRRRWLRFLFMPELLLVATLLVFLFAYVFASNANLTYVQRFIEGGGELRLAVDTEAERRRVFVRLFPLVVLDAAIYLFARLRLPQASRVGSRRLRSRVRQWALPLVFVSVLLTVLSLPSFASLDGIGILGWIALVPLFVVLRTASFGRALFYGVAFGALETLLVNYWLGTFNLVSLQFTVTLHSLFYVLFIPVLLLFLRRSRVLWVLVLPLAWTGFEYLTSIGFLGYPWGLISHSQYQFLSLIQVSSVTGMWGVTFLVTLASAVLSECVLRLGDGHRLPWRWLTVGGVTIGGVVLAGAVTVAGAPEPAERLEEAGDDTTRVALIQQNSDPRKHDYRDTFSTLRDLTDRALEADPDLVAWSETAFVPNIRRWGRNDPDSSFLAGIVHDFLAYQDSIDTWLLTGNDDYTITTNEEGEEERLNYNAAVLFDDEGDRRETYRKIKLVPFTEYFPYQEALPWVYELLQEFDVSFWEPGEEYTVFDYPGFSFATPICFEDAFPNHVRQYVRNGAEVILNMSNDYWSLNEVEAKQHFVAGLFRSVENRRPTLRSTASGLTAHVDPYGRILETRPYYSEEFLVTDVPPPPDRTTLYTRYGDWFPLFCIGALLLLWIGSELPRIAAARRAAAPARPYGAGAKGHGAGDKGQGAGAKGQGAVPEWGAVPGHRGSSGRPRGKDGPAHDDRRGSTDRFGGSPDRPRGRATGGPAAQDPLTLREELKRRWNR